METKSQTIHKCTICSKEFNFAYKLKRHSSVHSQTVAKPYKCNFCSKCFPQHANLNKHMWSHTGQRPYSCHNCGKDFSMKQILKKHLLTHAGEKHFYCHFCGKDFDQKTDLDQHMLEHPGEKQLMCHICSRCFSLENDLNAHLSEHTPEKLDSHPHPDLESTCESRLNIQLLKQSSIRPFKCEKCDKSFIQKGYLRAHEKIHIAEKPFSCTKCGKNFGYKQNLTTHMKTHTEEHPLFCNFCSRPFARRDYLEVHLGHHRGGFKVQECQSCEFISETKGTLKDFLRIHPESRPFKCKLCEDTFKCTTNFQIDERVDNIGEKISHQHILMHAGDKQLICNFCSRPFELQNDLDIHLLTHTQEKIHPCPHCAFKSSSKSRLKIHYLAKHNGIPPHKCSSCEKSFKQKGHLRDHERIHTGEKPFTCTKCAKDFTQKQQLTTHMKRHTQEKNFNICSRPFERVDNLGLHLIHHRGGKIHEWQSGVSSSKGILYDYLRTHTESRPFKKGLFEDTTKNVTYFEVQEEVQTMEENSVERDTITPSSSNTKSVMQAEKINETVGNNLASHSREAFECKISSKKCSEKYSLSKQLQTPSVEEPLKCQLCSYQTDSRDLLNHHERSHNEGGYFNCRNCSFSSNKKSMVAAHEIQAHPQAAFHI